VSLFKTLLKLMVLLAVGAIVTGVIIAVKRQKDASPITFDEWPSVPRNPDV
jgi:ABC-type phosphate transport system permease subunit